jgi:CBS domain-containing protein
MQAQEIMTRDVCTVGPDTPVVEIARRLTERRISAVPVVDAAGRVLGIVSEGDLIRRPEIGTEPRRSWWLELVGSNDERAREYTKTHGAAARDVMTRHVVVVDESIGVGDVAEILQANAIKRVPVVRDGKLVGIISRGDLVRALARSPLPGAAAANRDDRAIEAELKRRIQAEPWADSVYLNYAVRDHVVEFWGWARSADHRNALRVLAQSVPGVVRVDDNLTDRPATGDA